MGILGKLTFWKKKDDFEDIGKDLGLDKNFDMGMDSGTGMSPDLGLGIETNEPHRYPSMQQPMQQSSYPSLQPSPFQQNNQSRQMGDQEYINSKNLEVISSKLDAIRASLDSINHRLENLEYLARGEQDERKRKYF